MRRAEKKNRAGRFEKIYIYISYIRWNNYKTLFIWGNKREKEEEERLGRSKREVGRMGRKKSKDWEGGGKKTEKVWDGEKE